MSFNYSKLATLRPKFLAQVEKQNYPPNDQVDLRNAQADLNTTLDQKDRDDQTKNQQNSDLVDGHQPYIVDGHLQEKIIKVDGHQEQQTHPEPHNINKRKGDRHSTDKVKVTIRHKQDFYQKIKDFCQTKDLQIQDFYELAASQYMDIVDGHQQRRVDGHQSTPLTATNKDKWPSHDDLMIFKSHDDIIMLYKNLTSRRWTAADDRVGAKFNSVDRQTIELGMIQTYVQAKGRKINSFKYFVPEIENIIDAKFDKEKLDTYLKSRRKMLAKYQEQRNPNQKT